jgi:hypothetical protein
VRVAGPGVIVSYLIGAAIALLFMARSRRWPSLTPPQVLSACMPNFT